jgi:hypothetical protein
MSIQSSTSGITLDMSATQKKFIDLHYASCIKNNNFVLGPEHTHWNQSQASDQLFQRLTSQEFQVCVEMRQVIGLLDMFQVLQFFASFNMYNAIID